MHKGLYAEEFVSRTGAEIRHGGDRAYYLSSADHIRLPDRERFTGTATSNATESYYAIVLHELTHWTGHKSRLNRNMANRFATYWGNDRMERWRHHNTFGGVLVDDVHGSRFKGR
jgi:antirestriction protein ArdC